MASVTEQTLKQYDRPIQRWKEFCRSNDVSLYEPSLIDLLTFFTYIFNTVKSFSSLNTHRAALSLILKKKFEDEAILRRFFKGASAEKPQQPKYKSIWDPEPVLNCLENWFPHAEISMEMLTKKLVTLLALITGHRMQTISKIKISNIFVKKEIVEIRIDDKIKTSARNKEQPLLIIPFFVQNPKLCVASLIETYIVRTEKLREPDDDYLFLTFKKPYHTATTQSISRWVKTTLSQCGVDTNIFTAHSTRHASTSAAWRNGASIESIRTAAGWSERSSVFAKFYNKPLTSSCTTFANAVLSKK